MLRGFGSCGRPRPELADEVDVLALLRKEHRVDPGSQATPSSEVTQLLIRSVLRTGIWTLRRRVLRNVPPQPRVRAQHRLGGAAG